ncbi:MAG: tRNA uridine-5-carboxymethylaminomethyl(34) synthesis GTPase MnmE [Treponema sp.]|nr:tRNA uridine-5-carboxymethylaminomethyl(34) synthesis GTPase MnmE [Treponema sp.]
MTSDSLKRQYGDESPILAFATTPGNSALTLIRCSGKGSIDLVSSVFSADLTNAQGNTIIHGWISKNDNGTAEKIDEVLVSVFRAPRSYTGEDSADICCHGGASAGKAVMNVLKNAGFYEALPGEYTFRAFMNGKIDLTKSESVMEIVSAKTETGRRHAIMRLCGSLQNEINDIKDSLVKVLAGVEIYLDYSDDEVSADEDEAAGKLPNKNIAVDALERLKKLSASWQIERVYQEGITLVIAGRPNAGKSSLFNALLKEDRSIVTEIPGTTRDWIEAWVSIEGIPVRLIDTAGLRDCGDSVEKIGIDRSLKLLDEAEFVLYLLDGALEEITNEDKLFIEKHITDKRYVFVWNKADRCQSPPNNLQNIITNANENPELSLICISAKTGDGIKELYAEITSAISRQTSLQTGETFAAAVGTERQKNLVDESCRALEEALAMTEREEPLDLIAPLLRDAVNLLGGITGEVSTADILQEMFSRFCVGK